ncbi:MAG TPA: nucleotidyltransferase domain-containing protein, partial [Candidatus Dormibacteraeota bacterium]|nr:nucleotidyltransferase domain-containing protein [Candidatus Dormibacteraeota bacterium]
MFTPDYRARIRESLIEKARQDKRIESAAAVGGSAQGEPDRWSDLDLTFGVSDGARDEVLADWTASLRSDFDAVTLFDLPFMSSLYRVFL